MFFGTEKKVETAAAPILPSALAAEVADVDALASGKPIAPLPGARPAAAAAPIDPTDYTAEAADVIEFTYENFVLLYPSLATVYTQPVRKRLAEKGGAVLKKRGWTLDRLMDRWGAELALLMAVQPLVVPTYRAIQADRAAAEAPQEAGKPAQAPAPSPGAQEAPAGPPAAPARPGESELPPAPTIPMPA